MIMCPYCLTMQAPQQTNQCSNPKCGQRLPPKYLENARSGNLICLGTYGLPSHGKTAFLSSLMQSALAVSKIVPNSYVSTLDDDTRKKLNEWSALYREGRVKPPATPPNERPRPLLLMSKNFPSGTSTILAAYDLAGEALKQAGSQPEYVRALKQVNTIWCVVSLEDLKNHNDDGYSLDSLFNIYLDAMTEHHISIKGKNILVMYTKADLLLRPIWRLEPLPQEVIDYLADDPYDQLRETRGALLPPFDQNAYFQQMSEISDILREYTIDFVDGGAAFVNMINDEGAQVHFTINSAYGDALDSGNTLGVKVRSVRVLDALIWAIMLNTSAVSEQEVALIVPPTIESAGLTSQETILRFYDELTAKGGHVATYYPGQAEPAFPLGIRPVGVHSSGNFPLIGPILDRLKPGTAVVLLVKDVLPQDLGDLYASQWADKLLLVVARRDLAAAWLPHRGVVTQEGEIAPMVSAFLQHIARSRP